MRGFLDRVRALARHRLAKWVVFGALILLVVRVVGGLPSSLEVEYHLGAARDGLQRAAMRYLADGEEVRRVSFSYAGSPAGAVQVHSLQLLDGDYRVELELTYRDGRSERLSRPLIVRGSGRVSVFLNP